MAKKQGLYDPEFEKDSCGVGLVAHLNGEADHGLVLDALEILRRLEHRGACGAEENTGDGCGIMVALPHEFFEHIVQNEFSKQLIKVYILLMNHINVFCKGQEDRSWKRISTSRRNSFCQTDRGRSRFGIRLGAHWMEKCAFG